MLRRSTKFQLILFVVITLLGISYVGANYVGLTRFIDDNGCTVSADFPDSGGIFTDAEVTFRGVTVGKVGALHLIANGVRVDLRLDNCRSPRIPSSIAATIANRSVVGEQYVDLVPTSTTDPQYLVAGANIPMARNHIPVATETLLVNLDKLVRSVDLDNLRTTVSELGKAVAGRGEDLGRLLDATDSLLATADQPQNLDATIALIEDSRTVLQTQLDQVDPLTSWTRSLRLLSAQLKSSDPDIRRLLDHGPGDLSTVRSFISDNRTDFGVTLANLAVVGNLVVAHLGGVQEVLELYPLLAAGGPSALHDHAGALGLVLQVTQDPEDCGDPFKDREGYVGTQRRDPSALAPIAPNVAARCTAPVTGPGAKNVRGSAQVPGGDPISTPNSTPISTPGVDPVAPRTASSTMLRTGPSLARSTALGDGSWLGLLTDALH